MGKRILVVGSNSDTGKAVVTQLVKSNAKVVAQARNITSVKDIVNEYPETITPIEASLDTNESVHRLWSDSIVPYNGIDGIVYASAFSQPLKECIDNVWWDMWEYTMKVNVIAPAYLSMLMAKYCKDKSIAGKIIMITSRASHRGDDIEKMHYSASKAALSNITKTLSKNYKKHPLLLYNIAPGFVRTKRIEETILPFKKDDWLETDFPLSRMVDVQEIAELVEFIIMGNTSNLTGATFDINGATYLR